MRDIPSDNELIHALIEIFDGEQMILFPLPAARAVAVAAILQATARRLPDGHPFKAIAAQIGRQLQTIAVATLPADLARRIDELLGAGWEGPPSEP